MTSTPKIVFMGSPEFALPSLAALARAYPVVGVVTQPDRPAGRGKALTPPPVKMLAQSLGLPLIQPERLRAPGAFEQLQAWAPDLIVVAAFGQILRKNVLELPPFGCVNVHASLLPRWRGAAPIQAAILHGDASSGVTIMQMDAGVDTGAILTQRETPIRADDTAASLLARLSNLGAELLIETLPAYWNGSLIARPQDETQATYAPMLTKEAGLLDFSQSAAALARRVMAFNPWPGAFFPNRDGQMVKVQRASLAAFEGAQPPPGDRAVIAGLPAVAAADGWLLLEELQPAGKKPMPGAVFLRGARDWLD